MSKYVEVVEKKSSQVGPVAAMVIIVLIFILGGVYFLVKQEQRIRAQQQELSAPLPQA